MPRKKKEKKVEKPELPKKAYIFWCNAYYGGEAFLRCVIDMRDTKEAVGPIGEYALLAEGDATAVFVPKKVLGS